MKTWIFVESFKNWNEDFKHNFTSTGIDKKKFFLKKPKKGDLIFTYISKVKKISDMREIIDDFLIDTPKTFNYDKTLLNSISTKKLTVLKENSWIEFNEIVKELEVFATSKSPGLKLLNAPIELNNYDREVLRKIFNNKVK